MDNLNIQDGSSRVYYKATKTAMNRRYLWNNAENKARIQHWTLGLWYNLMTLFFTDVWWGYKSVSCSPCNGYPAAPGCPAHLQECTTTTSLFLCELCRTVSWICPRGDCPSVVPLGKQSRKLQLSSELKRCASLVQEGTKFITHGLEQNLNSGLLINQLNSHFK